MVGPHDAEISDSSFLRDLIAGNNELEKQRRDEEVAESIEAMKNEMAL